MEKAGNLPLGKRQVIPAIMDYDSERSDERVIHDLCYKSGYVVSI